MWGAMSSRRRISPRLFKARRDNLAGMLPSETCNALHVNKIPMMMYFWSKVFVMILSVQAEMELVMSQ